MKYTEWRKSLLIRDWLRYRNRWIVEYIRWRNGKSESRTHLPWAGGECNYYICVHV